MGKLSNSKMMEIEQQRAKRKEELRVLTATPFDVTKKKQIKDLKKYLDKFELSVNQMYLYQSLSSGLTAWFGARAIGLFLPIPDFITYFLTASLYFGVAGYVLETFSMTDFYEQLTELKEIYNWCLKGGSPDYSSDRDNTDNLDHPEIQRMVKLIAPLCSTDFMLAWPKESTSEEPKGTWSSVLYSGYTAASSFFSSSGKPGVNLNRIHELKVGVETRGFDVGVFNGFEQSIRYFVTNPDFRKLMNSIVNQPLDTVKNILPAAISSLSSSHSS